MNYKVRILLHIEWTISKVMAVYQMLHTEGRIVGPGGNHLKADSKFSRNSTEPPNSDCTDSVCK